MTEEQEEIETETFLLRLFQFTALVNEMKISQEAKDEE
jgi:hypothetical protein